MSWFHCLTHEVLRDVSRSFCFSIHNTTIFLSLPPKNPLWFQVWSIFFFFSRFLSLPSLSTNQQITTDFRILMQVKCASDLSPTNGHEERRKKARKRKKYKTKRKHHFSTRRQYEKKRKRKKTATVAKCELWKTWKKRKKEEEKKQENFAFFSFSLFLVYVCLCFYQTLSLSLSLSLSLTLSYNPIWISLIIDPSPSAFSLLEKKTPVFSKKKE